MIVGFFIYPIFSDIFVNSKINKLAKIGIFYMNLSIPIRMLIFISTMILYTTKSKSKIWYIYLITIVLNALLSWYFIYFLDFGFKGSYYSTLIIISLELFWLMYLLIKEIRSFPFSFFNFRIILDLFNKIFAEGLRLISWQLEGFVIFAILASRETFLPILNAFSLISPFLDLILMPLIALMRASAIEISKNEKSNISNSLFLIKSIIRKSIIISALSGFFLIILSYYFSNYLYNLDDFRQGWWNSFIIIFGIFLPLFSYGYLLRSCFQACGDFSSISKIEISLTWIIFIPILIISILNSNSWMFFLSYIIAELSKIIFLKYKVRRIQTRNIN